MAQVRLIDGASGEGGGQILRSSLALSLVTGTPLRIENIRAGRRKPGLLRQHLTALEAAVEVGEAVVTGAELGSGAVEFRPRARRAGDYHFAVGTAGSAVLVAQTILPALLSADGPSRLTVEGGTHNPAAPPFDFFARVFLPLLCRLGPDVRAVLERPGFYPAGGGCFRVEVAPVDVLEPFDLLERGEIRTRRARALLAQLPDHVGERELAQVRASLGWRQDETVIERVADSRGPGNALLLEVEAEHVTEICTAFGERGLRAEAVARKAAGDMGNYLRGRAPVGPWLADQLLVPLALAGGGAFRTSSPTPHTRTNIEVIEKLLDVDVELKQEASDDWRVVISRRKGGQG